MNPFRSTGLIQRLYREIRNITGEWKLLLEKPLPKEELDVLMYQASIPSFGYFFLMMLASALATFGLLANNVPTVIGAMIIAPMMAPVLGTVRDMVPGMVPETTGRVRRTVPDTEQQPTVKPIEHG